MLLLRTTLAACALALVACGGPQLAEPVAPALRLQVPATLEAVRPRAGDPRTVHVRVWADAAVRATPRWREDVNDELDYATQVLTPLLGVRLQVDAIREWDRAGEPGGALGALQVADPGADVTWVIGFVAAPDRVATAMSDLGDAQPLGRHVVVRAWAEAPETAALTLGYPTGAAAEAQRAEFLAAHRRHKETVVLLHELATTLGAIAEVDPGWIQHLAYGLKQSTFSDRNRELMQLALDMRLAETAPDQIAHALLDGIDKAEWGGWVPAQHDDVVATLRNIADSAKAGKTAADVPSAAYAQFDRIRQLRVHTPAQALTELDNLLAAYPANATMHQLKCEMLLDAPGVKAPETRAACARVTELAPGDPTVHLALGEALYTAGDAPGARAELVAAAARIKNLDKGAPDAWRRVIGVYAAHGALTWTEEAMAQGGLAGDPAGATVATTRARAGIPRGATFVTPADEGALAEAVAHARELVEAKKTREAQAALAAAEKRWPAAPGLLGERCELALYSGATGAAAAACDAALRGDPQDSWVLYLAGVIALKDTSAAGARAGIDRLRRAIAADPELGPAWRALGKAYARIKDQAALADLGAAYAAKFGAALPP